MRRCAAGTSWARWTPAPAGTPTAGPTRLPYFGEHAEVGTGADARGPALLILDKAAPGIWRARQILDDPAGDHDWGFDAEVDLEASDEEGIR